MGKEWKFLGSKKEQALSYKITRTALENMLSGRRQQERTCVVPGGPRAAQPGLHAEIRRQFGAGVLESCLWELSGVAGRFDPCSEWIP